MSSPHGIDWTLITVTYNSATSLRAAWTTADLGGARWLVVDNASTDDSVAVARSLGAEVIELPQNVGFGAANNVALDRVVSDWVGFVNPDLTVGTPADLDRLAAVSLANGGALVAPQLLNTDGTEQSNGRGLPYLVDKFANRGLRLPGSRIDDYVRVGHGSPTYVAWATGAAVMAPVEVMRRLGGWDERYFVYYEDSDLCLRAWDLGVPVVVDPAVRWVHAWARATTKLAVAPWRLELRSARTFFSTYPALLSPRRRTEPGSLLERIGQDMWMGARDG